MASVQQMVQRYLDKIQESIDDLNQALNEGDIDQMISASDDIASEADRLSGRLEKVSASLADEEDEQGQDEAEQPDQGDDEAEGKPKPKSRAKKT